MDMKRQRKILKKMRNVARAKYANRLVIFWLMIKVYNTMLDEKGEETLREKTVTLQIRPCCVTDANPRTIGLVARQKENETHP